MLEKLFKLRQGGATVNTEISAGITTFMAMAYIIFVNPAILEKAGLPFETTMAATCAVAGICTILMGLCTNYPFALASGMGLNAFLTYTVCIGMNLPWQTGMAIVVIEGLIITILVLTRVRGWVMSAIPMSLKMAISVGIGFFLAFIGLKDSGIIVSHAVTFVAQGNLSSPPVIVALIGLIFTIFLMSIGIRGAILVGILATALIGIPFGVTQAPSKIIALPSFYTFGGFIYGLKEAASIGLWTTIFAFLISDFFDTMGTVVGISAQGGFLKPDGSLPRLNRVLFVDSLGALLGGIFSVSSVTTYVESSAGVAQGGRTGLTSVTTGILFLLAVFFSPLAQIIGGGYKTPDGQYLYPIIAPALIIVGFLMIKAVQDISWMKFEDALPAFLTILIMPFTFSISQGIGWGFISYTLIKVFSGKSGELHPLMIVLSCLFAFSFSPWVPK